MPGDSLTSQLRLLPRLRMKGSVPLLPLRLHAVDRDIFYTHTTSPPATNIDNGTRSVTPLFKMVSFPQLITTLSDKSIRWFVLISISLH
jgi:hypothetical protein